MASKCTDPETTRGVWGAGRPPKLQSGPFTMPGLNATWSLLLYPFGEDEPGRGRGRGVVLAVGTMCHPPPLRPKVRGLCAMGVLRPIRIPTPRFFIHRHYDRFLVSTPYPVIAIPPCKSNPAYFIPFYRFFQLTTATL